MRRGSGVAASPLRRCDWIREREHVHVYGRAGLAAEGELRLQVLSIERFGLGAHLAALERLKQQLAAEGLFAAERKHPLPRFPRQVGLVTGNDAAAKHDVVASVTRASRGALLVAETRFQGPTRQPDRASPPVVRCAAWVDMIVLAPGGERFEDLLVQRRAARQSRVRLSCNRGVRGRTGAGHATLDLAADVRASTPTAAAASSCPTSPSSWRPSNNGARRSGAGRAPCRSPPRRLERRPTACATAAACCWSGVAQAWISARTASCPLATRDPRPSLRHRPQGKRGRADGNALSAGELVDMSSRKAASAHGSEARSDRRGADVRAGRGGAADDRRAAGVRRCRDRRGDRAGSAGKTLRDLQAQRLDSAEGKVELERKRRRDRIKSPVRLPAAPLKPSA